MQEPEQEMMETPSHPLQPRWPAHLIFQRCGIGVLLVGLISAALVFCFAANGTNDGSLNDSSKLYDYQVERFGGQTTLLMVKFNHWLSGLWHGRPLAYTLAFLSILVAMGCFWLADLTKEDPDEN